MAVQEGRSNLAQGLIGRAGDELSQGFDWAGLPTPAAAPDVPDFYGQGLGQMGTAPNARSDVPFPTASGGGGQASGMSGLMRGFSNKGANGPPGPGGLTPWGQTPAPGNQGNLPGRGPAADPTLQGLGATGQGPNTGLGNLGATGQGPNTAMGNLGAQGQGPNAAMGNIGAAGQGPTQAQYNPEDIQRGLDFSGEQNLNAGGGYNPDFAQTQFDRQMSLQQPLMERATTQMDTKLRNQGLSPGTPAYDNAMNDLRNNQGEQTSRMQQDSMRLGAQEQQSQFARELQARQQGVGEVAQQGGFANQASQQALQQQLGIGSARYGESLGAGQFTEAQRAARAGEAGQQFGQDLAGGQYTDAQRAQRASEMGQQFGQELAGGQFTEAQRAARAGESGQQFGQQLAGGQFTEAQRAARAGESGQQYGQNLQASQQLDSQRGQALQEQQQQFQQGLAGSQQQNSLRAQQFAEQQTREQAQGGAAQAQFQRELDMSKYQDQQRAQQVSEQLAYGQQGFQQQMQQSQYQQGLRQQAIAEEAQRRGMSINEMNALISGQQVSTPQMPNFQGASKAAPVNYLGAAQAQGNFDQQGYATALGPVNALLGNQAIKFGPSDIRLKENIQRIGVYKGLDIVRWTWNGLMNLTGDGIGFIAQQVQTLYPEYVHTFDNGYLGIDYARLMREV